MLLLSASIANAEQCAAPPLNLPIRSLSNVPGMIAHGIPISIGTPPQQFVLTPSLQLDTSFIPRYTNSCIYDADSTIPANDTRWSTKDRKIVCAGIYGGGFVPSLSTTFHDNGTNSPVSEAWFKKARFSDWHFTTDEFAFVDHVEAYVQQNEVLPDKRSITSSFILPNEGATFGGMGSSALSVTPASRLLETLKSEGIIPSKSWSLSNESLCLGCIDENAYVGDFQKVKLSDRDKDDGLPCLLQVKVEMIDYYSDAQTAGVALLHNAFGACIDPGVAFLVFPTETRAKLLEVAGAAGSDVEAYGEEFNTSSGLLEASSSFLRLRLEGDLEVDINIPGVEVGDTENTGGLVFAIKTSSWGAYGQGVPVLGKPFTDSVVLRWDETAQEYGIAKKNIKAAGESILKPLGCDGFPSASGSARTAPSVGVIVGSIIGGFVAGLLFAAAAVFFYWRGQKGVRSKYEAMSGEDTVSLRTVDTGGRTMDSRLSGLSGTHVLSLRESLRSSFGARSISPVTEPYLVDDSQVYEAPEGGPVDPSRYGRNDIRLYSYNQR